MQLKFHIEGGDFTKAGFASSEVKKYLRKINVSNETIKRIVIAMYEAEVNVAAHAYEGDVLVNIDSQKVDITINDKGPGIEDIEQAMKEGFSTASQKVREMGFGAGMGLSNIKRNANEFTIKSQPGEGTSLNIIVYLNSVN
jgi:anti-sigma regulatory factor (Ser/Thr protein kinase)